MDDELSEIALNKGFVESQMFSNIKLVLAAFLVFFGAYSYIKLQPIERFFTMNVLFLIGYFLCSCAYYYVENFMEKETFFKASKSGVKDLQRYRNVRFSSDIGVYDGNYSLILSGETTTGKEVKAQVTYSCGKFFDSEGYLHRDKVMDLYKETLKAFLLK